MNSYFIKHKSLKGQDSPAWKNGRSKSHGYWRLWMPDYFSSHKDGRVHEHVYNYQEYHKLCMLPWGDVHHIDGNKSNNMIWNLQGLMKREHTSIHSKGNRFRRGKHIYTSDRFCYICKSKTTTIRKPDNKIKTPCPVWYHLPWDKINWYCHNCVMKDYYRRKKKTMDPSSDLMNTQ
jgi:hypothetical protein